MADLHSKILDAQPSSPIFFIFMQFSTNFVQIIGWHPLWEILDPPLELFTLTNHRRLNRPLLQLSVLYISLFNKTLNAICF